MSVVSLPSRYDTIRGRSRPSSAHRRKRATSAASVPMSWTPVRPTDSNRSCAAASRAASSSGPGSGIAASISSSALSMKTPVAFPSSSRTIRPPSGSGVAAVIPAKSIALRFAQLACPSTRVNHTGWSGAAASSGADGGNSRTSQSF